MPHISLDYAPRLAEVVDIAALCDLLRRTAIDTGVFPMPGVRVRAFAADHVSMADGNPDFMYVDISVRLRAGREMDIRRSATETIFAAARGFLAPALAEHPIALSMEMRDIDPDLSPKYGTIRDHLQSGAPA
ncbi:5-carboxymethyl-2-hydroxymuconate Delta-isomerase [Phaeobacter sp. B1627]|uniref:5-carboxymethyl-2-hydroxymuconate Delta-isomerase n=1 Tax=Phaeobacter sp. B1627 TaxID=2583809 RepID=UPI001118CCD1|nr:5-carboxymethyl-2-hydroxymuconate Delta-isomerase [Phaeobacter sp. B1627]TNJ41374.1 5-carboxymethyl-2-hydroxymuconate Delta-isomerase [Phaeobacter sp. B1627]